MKSILLVLGGTLLFVASSFAADAAKPRGDVFPFVKGHYWLYDGQVKFAAEGKTKEQQITGWRSEVIDTAEATTFKAALLKGHPHDLAWYSDETKRSDTLVILTSSGEFHEVSDSENLAQTFQTLKSSGVLPDKLIRPDTILFKFPPKVGDRFGDPEQVKLGARYCWAVTDVTTEKPAPAIKGAPSEQRLTIALTFRTSPDHTNVLFAAGIGITSYTYVHHGTPGDCEMRLVECGESSSKSASESK
ncbi:hypothetical protein [Prosthecobacter sp.]|uniref:hypothetical protein n=1 Tax=Prosthecobacter sp. TaxID=1965333 RepID=UPI0037838DC0